MKGTGTNQNTFHRINTLSLSAQARDSIQEYIRSMDLRQGTKLPREEVMADMLGVSRITVRQALADLAAEGIIFRRQGKGTFVNKAALNVTVTFNPVMEFMQMIQRSGYQPSMKLLNFEEAGGHEEVRKILRLSGEDRLLKTEKAFLADNRLCVLCRDYFGLSLIEDKEAFEQASVYEKSVYPYIYEKSGKKLIWDKVEIGTAVPDEVVGFEAYLKEQKDGAKSYLYLKELNYGEDDRPLIYVEEYIDTSIIRYNMIRQKDIDYGKWKRNGGV